MIQTVTAVSFEVEHISMRRGTSPFYIGKNINHYTSDTVYTLVYSCYKHECILLE